MNNLEQRMDVDCVWKGGPPTTLSTHLLVYNQDEHGYATTIAGQALIGDERPIANFYSKLMNVPSLNFAPHHNWQESYRLYEVWSDSGQRYFILRMPRVHDVDLSYNGLENDHSWLYTYPIIRDIILILNQYGVNRLSYMTSNLFQLHKQYSQYGKLEHGHIATFDWVNSDSFIKEYFGKKAEESSSEYIFSPNVWMWCKLFCDFNYNPKKAEVILCKGDIHQVDVDSADSLLNHITTTYGLPVNEEQLNSITKQATDAVMNNYVKLDLEDEQDDYDMTGWEA